MYHIDVKIERIKFIFDLSEDEFNDIFIIKNNKIFLTTPIKDYIKKYKPNMFYYNNKYAFISFLYIENIFYEYLQAILLQNKESIFVLPLNFDSKTKAWENIVKSFNWEEYQYLIDKKNIKWVNISIKWRDFCDTLF